MKFVDYIHLFRVSHWIKSGFVLAPAFFSGRFISAWESVVLAGLAFAIVASSVYIINDIRDVDYDKNNSEKVNVFAIGKMSIETGWMLAAVLLIGGLAIQAINNWILGYWLLAYFAMNVIYSMGVKQIPYLEMLFVMAGFIIRIMYGADVAGVPNTGWLYIEVVLFTGLIVSGKRLKEIRSFQASGKQARKVLSHYRRRIFEIIFGVMSLALAGVYIAYCLNTEVQLRVGNEVLYTVPIVLFGVGRYVYRVVKLDGSMNPVRMLYRDIWIALSVLSWVVVWLYVLYGKAL